MDNANVGDFKMITHTELHERVLNAILRVKNETPFAPSITNSVTINFVANAQLAVGGSAAMVCLPDEGEAMAYASKSLYINIGTDFPFYRDTLQRTAKACAECENAWVLDPVAIGIGSQRTELLRSFKQYPPKIIRGNASEIIALAKLWDLDFPPAENSSAARGVDSTCEVDSARGAAIALANFTGGAVAVSGKTDLVTDGSIVCRCFGGSSLMPLVTGMGCSLGGVCSVYSCVTEPFIAALCGTLLYNKAAFFAEKKCSGPASFYTAFLDSLYKITHTDPKKYGAKKLTSFHFEIEEN